MATVSASVKRSKARPFQIAAFFVLFAVGGTWLYKGILRAQVADYELKPIKPGNVNLIALKTGGNYRIIVSNQIAQLAEVQRTSFEGPTSYEDTEEEATNKKRIPLKEMLLGLQGDEKALSKFVMIMNELKEADLPAERVIWEPEDIQKALDGDEPLRKKLTSDLNVNLDGTPLDQLSIPSIENGIVVKAPVKIRVVIDGGPKILNAYILEPYRPRFAREVAKRYSEKFVDTNAIRGYYMEEAKRVLDDPKERENVANTLRDYIDPVRLARYAEIPERLLGDAQVLVTENHVVDASYVEEERTDNRRRFRLSIQVNDEGKRRLWKYSMDHKGVQILLVANGVAIAAPRIATELTGSDFTIDRMPDEDLLKDAVKMINDARTGGK
ncbi:MAG: hypothetical protein HONBIEJF_00663 [Fimbriimonadaceae bacterium]|nr:hypothetical protein [Fimbriimonadaceae bacterium]